MPVPVILPKFGFTLETAEIVQWLARDGDEVRAGDPICEVTTDKVNMEVEAPEDGTIFGLRYEAGATVPVTEVICYLLRPGETRPDSLPDAVARPALPEERGESGTPATVTELPRVAATPVARRVAQASNVDLEQVQGTGPNGRIMRRDVELAAAQPAGKVRATPAARRLAREGGLALEAISGSGPRGRVQGADVRAALAAMRGAPQAEPAAALTSLPQAQGEYAPEVIRLEGMRRTIAARLQKSFQTAPHIFIDAQIDAGPIEALRHRLKARHERLSVTSVLVKACAAALLRHPWLNATTDGEAVSLWPTANIGVAVALETGLVVPVIHHAERLGLREIQGQVDVLRERAHSNTLHVQDVLDGTFTISNMGMFGVDRFTAIINPPQVAILAVGRTMRQFVPDENGQPMLQSVINMTLSADHRVVDGAHAARFLADLRTILEEPALLAW